MNPIPRKLPVPTRKSPPKADVSPTPEQPSVPAQLPAAVSKTKAAAPALRKAAGQTKGLPKPPVPTLPPAPAVPAASAVNPDEPSGGADKPTKRKSQTTRPRATKAAKPVEAEAPAQPVVIVAAPVTPPAMPKAVVNVVPRSRSRATKSVVTKSAEPAEPAKAEPMPAASSKKRAARVAKVSAVEKPLEIVPPTDASKPAERAAKPQAGKASKVAPPVASKRKVDPSTTAASKRKLPVKRRLGGLPAGAMTDASSRPAAPVSEEPVKVSLPGILKDLGLTRKKTPAVQLPPIPPILLEDYVPTPRPALATGGKLAVGAPSSVNPVSSFSAALASVTSAVESVSSLGAGISVPAPSLDKAARLAGFPSGGSLWLTARDPFCVCLNWEFDRAALNAFAEAHPGGGWWLRLRAGSAGGWIANEQPLPIDADFRFVPVMFAGATFVAEVGYRFADGGWRGLSVSQPATTPPDSPSEAGPVTVARFEADPVTPDILVRSVPDHPEAVARPGQLPALPESRLLTTLVWESSVKRSGPSSAEVAEWVAREVTIRVPGDRGAAARASGLPSPSSAELALPAPESSPASEAVPAVPPPPPGFWFKVNAELIIYGSTEADATVTIAGRPVRLRPDGSFSFRFALPDGEFTLPVVARNAAGTDGRSAGLRFSRATVLAGEVEVHPQDAALRPPVAEAIS
jgi:hypothetical protein